jgi:hypothetical protein
LTFIVFRAAKKNAATQQIGLFTTPSLLIVFDFQLCPSACLAEGLPKADTLLNTFFF